MAMELLTRSLRAANLLIRSPGGFLRRLHAQARPDWKGTIAIGGVRFEVDLALDPTMRKMYCGSYETDVIDVLRRILRPGDIFVDVGANVGYLSAVALELVGEHGQVHAFEPVPRYFRRLERLAAANPRYSLHVNPVALGSETGAASIAVTSLPNIGWNTMVPSFMSAEGTLETITVPVTTLSDYLDGHALVEVALVKIDTEGFELPVLRGFRRFLSACERRPVIVAEVAPAAYEKLGTELAELVRLMHGLGYQTRSLDGRHAPDLTTLTVTTNVLFVPNATGAPGPH